MQPCKFCDTFPFSMRKRLVVIQSGKHSWLKNRNPTVMFLTHRPTLLSAYLPSKEHPGQDENKRFVSKALRHIPLMIVIFYWMKGATGMSHTFPSSTFLWFMSWSFVFRCGLPRATKQTTIIHPKSSETFLLFGEKSEFGRCISKMVAKRCWSKNLCLWLQVLSFIFSRGQLSCNARTSSKTFLRVLLFLQNYWEQTRSTEKYNSCFESNLKWDE